MTILITLFSILCALIVLSLFWPLLRGVPNPLIFFTNGSDGQSGTADLKIRRRVLLENLRDIQIERDFGKLSADEYQALAAPLVAELDQVERRLGSATTSAGPRTIRRNRLGWFCPDCGNLNHLAKKGDADQADKLQIKNQICIQCGLPAGVHDTTATTAPTASSTGTPNALTLIFAGFALGGALLLPARGLYAQMPGGGPAQGPENVVFRGEIQNGTRNGSPAKVERLELIQLGEGVMQTVQVIENAGPTFQFQAVPRPTGPHLIRATYQGESYSTMVPPAPNFYLQPQQITVFEPGADRRSVQITSAMRVTKLKGDRLAIQQFMVISNDSVPPRSFDPRGYHVYLPDGAETVRASLQHESTRMPIPLNLEPVADKPNRYRVDRGVRPGNSQLVIDYDLPDVKFVDALPDEKDAVPGLPPARTPAGSHENPHNFRIVFWQPGNARPTISGAQAETIEIPNIGEALRVVYPGGGQAVTFDFSAGGHFVENPMQSDTNPLFDTPTQTIVGVLSGLIVFFLIASIIAGSGLRVVPRRRT